MYSAVTIVNIAFDPKFAKRIDPKCSYYTQKENYVRCWTC